MDRDPLNFFQPFERLPANHENQLTRALLLVLRLSPIAHECWLVRVGKGHHLHELPAASFDTQRREVRVSLDAEEQVPLVSVFLAPEKPLGEDAVVVESDRRQVLDAVISYGDALVVVVENKVAEASDVQARELNVAGAGVHIETGQEREVVTWPEVIGDIAGILERGLAGGTEAAVLADFLAYVEDHFAELGPYRTLSLCSGNEFRTARRLRTLLGEVAHREARIDRWGPTVDLPDLPGIATRAYLQTTSPDSGVELSVCPADTLSQARVFYTRAHTVAAVRKLAERSGWQLHPNFHFGHMAGGYVWCTGKIDTDRYLHLWQQRIAHTVAVKRGDWDAYWDWLERESVVSPEDRAEFDLRFTATHRSTATPRPGLVLARRWDMPEAERLDAQRALTGQIADALQDAAAALSTP
ncbi:MAG TPA: hypothetical protein VID70_11420 [Solirubrobacteraceae bacterium]|jgi:hypothetical protein